MTKLNLYCGILVPILTYGMQVVYANLGSLSASEIILKPATKCICGGSEEGYKARLDQLGLLLLSRYNEMHDIFSLSKFVRDQFDVEWRNRVTSFQPERITRAADCEYFVRPEVRLSISRQNVWYRGICLQ